MSYSPPSIGSSGIVIPSYTDILNNLIAQFQAIYGATVYLGTDSADYQDIAVRALQATDCENGLLAVYLSFNPLTATGPSLDLLGKLIGTARKTASFSSAMVTLSGTAGTVVSNGVVQDGNLNLWNLPSSVTIGVSGTVTVTATAQQLGNITANASTITRIATPTAGWISVTNAAAAVAGQAVEADSQYRARLLVAQAKPSLSLLAGTAAAVAEVAGVTRSQVYENPTGSTDANGNPPHSITCVVEGGTDANIAAAIYNNRGIGCLTNGTTSVTVTDPNNGGLSLSISFTRLGYALIYVAMDVHPLTGFTTATQAAIQASIVSYLNSLGIGESVVFSELYGAALNARDNPDQPLFSIRSALSGSAAAQTTGSTTSGSPTVTVASATGIVNGQTVVGNGIPANTTITISGTTVTLSANATATAAGVALTFFTTGTSDIAIPFNKAPQGASLNVVLTLV